jgi:hypothetical protein
MLVREEEEERGSCVRMTAVVGRSYQLGSRPESHEMQTIFSFYLTRHKSIVVLFSQ